MSDPTWTDQQRQAGGLSLTWADANANWSDATIEWSGQIVTNWSDQTKN